MSIKAAKKFQIRGCYDTARALKTTLLDVQRSREAARRMAEHREAPAEE